MLCVEYHLLLILIFLVKSGISQDRGNDRTGYVLDPKSSSFWRCFRGLTSPWQ